MKDYAIFFDLDDTLYDRSRPFEQAFLEKFPSMGETALRAYRACEKRGNEVFLPSQRGEITMEEMYIYRYRKGLADVGIGIKPEEALEFQAVYRERQKEISLKKETEELLDYCTEHFGHVGLITNGPGEKQLGKVKTLGLDRWIPGELMLISGILKVDKPDPAIFHLAEQRAETPPERMIYAGDSFENDICPAHALGWKTVYLNRKCSAPAPGEISPDLVLEGQEMLTGELLERLLAEN